MHQIFLLRFWHVFPTACTPYSVYPLQHVPPTACTTPYSIYPLQQHQRTLVLAWCESHFFIFHARCRVLALKLLCEIRLDKDDLRSAIELSMKPVKPPSRPPSGKTRAGGSSTRARPEPSIEPSMDVRHEPLGEDAQGVIYWYLDLGPEGHTSLTGNAPSNQLCVEIHVTVNSSCVRCNRLQGIHDATSMHRCPLRVMSQMPCVVLARLPIAVLIIMYVESCTK